jgi:hypothetical protein
MEPGFYFQLHEIEKRIVSGLEFENRKTKRQGGLPG